MRSLQTNARHILTFGSEEATLQTTGGKGMNLSRLAAAGLPVPDGFIITTGAYYHYLRANRLEPRISEIIEELRRGGTDSTPRSEELQGASEAIEKLFSGGTVEPGMQQEMLTAYEALGSPPVAVRSSATAEDLPDLSFAGQQDTYLNVVGPDQLISSVVSCWASLWTARAIGYRMRNSMAGDDVALAVVVQRMVQSEASGVLFTANPVSGLRSETVVEATIGLGEALVSGMVEPDRFVIDAAEGRIVERRAGSKETIIRARDGGGTVSSTPSQGTLSWSISEGQALRLAEMGRRVADIYGTPQDIEWAVVADELFLLQSRPITSLFPIPKETQAEPLNAFASFGAIQGLLDPLTPFGADLLKQFFATASHLFGFDYTRESQRSLLSAGGRLWINVTTLLHNSVGRRAVRGAMAYVEPAIGQALDLILDDPRFAPQKRGMGARGIRRIARFLLPVAVNLIHNILSPQHRRQAIVRRTEAVLQKAAEHELRGATPLDRLASVVDFIERTVSKELPANFPRLVSGVAAGMASLNLLSRSAKRDLPPEEAEKPGMAQLAIKVTRGVPDNPTTQMDLELWRIATLIRAEPSTTKGLTSVDAAALAEGYRTATLQPDAQAAIARFLDRYGSRGLAEIDAGRPRWREEPQGLFETLAAYLQIRDPERSPEAVFERSKAEAEAAVEEIVTAAGRSARGIRGRARAARARFAAGRARGLLGFREYPKFFAVRLLDAFRRRLLAVGEELEREGKLRRSDDLVYLSLNESSALAHGTMSSEELQGIVEKRREESRRESARRQVPRLLLSDGRAFYEGIDAGAAGSDRINGSPVSPGSIEARARVVLDPRRSELEPGEIMVCPGTDPSWTPLFLVAGGLIMEVGGMMTHGAVVAREYGIPAVVGVHEATIRIETGTLVRLDGSSGTVTIL